jgi:hypothetical protein
MHSVLINNCQREDVPDIVNFADCVWSAPNFWLSAVS